MTHYYTGFPSGSESKEPACNVGDPGSIPGLGRSPGEGNGNPLQYSCLKNPMDSRAWQNTVHGVTKRRTWLSNFTFIIIHPGMWRECWIISWETLVLISAQIIFDCTTSLGLNLPSYEVKSLDEVTQNFPWGASIPLVNEQNTLVVTLGVTSSRDGTCFL